MIIEVSCCTQDLELGLQYTIDKFFGARLAIAARNSNDWNVKTQAVGLR